jgi:hypothetical protein
MRPFALAEAASPRTTRSETDEGESDPLAPLPDARAPASTETAPAVT